jgi:hypothetical protein
VTKNFFIKLALGQDKPGKSLQRSGGLETSGTPQHHQALPSYGDEEHALPGYNFIKQFFLQI